jgi:glutamyl-Q tRNA(Asp) synthetase
MAKPMPAPVFRFAPSPNGYLHLGHALSALVNFERARRAQGRFLLRIEDIDRSRCQPQFEAAIYEDLAWLGISWETPVRRQSAHMADYAAALARLQADGLVYAAFESRAEIARMVAKRESRNGSWPRDPDGVPLYPGNAGATSEAGHRRRMGAGESFALRLRMDAACQHAGPLTWSELDEAATGEAREIIAAPQAWGDVILARKDTPTSYHLSVVVDDAAQGVTHVVRGADLLAATSVHRLLQTVLGLPAPLYCHHRLILGPDGRKLSKSTRATALRSLRENGATPADIRLLAGLDRR